MAENGNPPRENLVRAMQPALELRSSDDGKPPTLFGHFAVFNQWAEINSVREGHFMERIAPGAFAKTFKENRGRMKCLFEHGRDPQIGNKVLGTIGELGEDDQGAYYEVQLLDTSYNRDLLPGLEQGLYGSSFRFNVLKWDVEHMPKKSAYNPKGLPEHTLRELAVPEFGPCTWNAYGGATAGVRSLTDEVSDGPSIHVHVAGSVVSERDLADTIRDGLSSVARADRGHDHDGYERCREFIQSTPWAMHPSSLAVVLAIVAERAAGHTPTPEQIRERIALSPTRQEPADGQESPRGSVAVLPIRGAIVPRANLMTEMSGGTSLDMFRSDFRAAVADDTVRAILLDVDSPGGSVDLVAETAAEIMAARGTKPIVAVANTWAASAAYHLAVAADEIVVTPSGEVGSIGVYSAHQDISAAQEKLGIKTTLVKAGKYKAERNPFEPLSEEAAASMQAHVDAVYDMFVDAVAKGRGVKAAAVRSGFGQGRMVMAEEAVKEGMADRVATFDETLRRLEKEHARSALADAGADRTHGHSGGASRGEATSTTATATVAEALATDGAGASHSDGASRDTGTDTPRKEGTMTIQDLIARDEEIKARMKELDSSAIGRLAADDQDEWDKLEKELGDVRADIEAYERRQRFLGAVGERPKNTERGDDPGNGVRGGGGGWNPGGSNLPRDIYAVEEYRSGVTNLQQLAELYREGAKQALEAATLVHERADDSDSKPHIERLLENDPNGELARRLLVTGGPVYRRAFAKHIVGRALTSQEAAALEAGDERALSLTTTAGGFAVPFQLDASIILTSNGVVNPIRAISRVESITTNEWRGVSSAGITASYAAEAAEASDNSPTLAQPVCFPERAQAFIPFSREIGDDWGALESEMALLIQDAKDTLESAQFTTGLGHASNVPQGLLVGGTAIVTTVGTAALAVADLYSLEEALPPRFRPRARMIGNKFTFNKVRQLDTAGGANLWVRLDAASPPELIGYPAHENSAHVAALTSAGTILTIGDFNNFLIVDRIGMSIEVIPHLFATANNRPSGQRGLYAYWRNSSQVLAWQAFRSLKTL